MAVVHLVRHGRPNPGDGPGSEWPLDPDRLDDIDRLRESGVLPTDARWFTSPERKAVATAERLGQTEAMVVADLREQERPPGVINDLDHVIVRALSDPGCPPLPGWETARSTRDRLVSAVTPLMDRHHPLVLVGHGFAWTLLVAHMIGTDPDLNAWQRLLMPDHCSVEDGRVVSSWSQWNFRN